MKKKRVIPVILLRNGQIVQSKLFNEYKNLGNPFKAVERFSSWDADELIYLEISKKRVFERTDLNSIEYGSSIDLLRQIAESASMPITFGGGIRSIVDIEARISNGADKVSINTLLFVAPEIVREASVQFGSQALVASVDVSLIGTDYYVFSQGINTKIRITEWVSKISSLGVGEILLNVIDRDGSKKGFAIDLYRNVSAHSGIPIIALGGAGTWQHFADILQETQVDAVAAANIFQFQDQSVYHARRFLFENGLPVRPPSVMD
jgi:cyclase